MGVQITVRDSGITNGMKSYAQDKADRLTKFFDGVQGIEVILDTDGPKKKAEIIMSVSGGDAIAVHGDHDQMNAAIDLALDRAELRLKKHKEKLRDHHRGEAGQPLPQEKDPEDSLESYQEIVDKTEFSD